MRGGSVVVAAGNYGITADQFGGGLALEPLEDGLREMLSSYGIQVEESLVMDPQNEPFPVQVTRQVGTFQVQEIQAIDYPFFVDVRSDGMASDSPIVSNLPAVTLNWASPITIDEGKNADRQVTTLLQSSPAMKIDFAESWVHLRKSNTEPIIRIYSEAKTREKAEELAITLIENVQSLVK